MAETARVRLKSQEVGLLEYFPQRGGYLFSFSAEYLSNPDREVLGQLFEDARPQSISTTGMPNWFANLLPQHNLRRIVINSLGIQSTDEFGLLMALGHDLSGAVELVPTEPRVAVTNASITPVSVLTPPPGALKISLAGVQMKLTVEEGERGLTVPVSGSTGRLIAKFEDRRLPNLPEVESRTMLWAKYCGIDVPDFRLASASEVINLPPAIDVGTGSVFLITRFDRVGESSLVRVHMEDFAQILDRSPGEGQYEGSYEEVGAVLARIAPDSAEEFVRRLVFSVLVGNGDAHLKNWSVVYPDGRNARISPAYDLISTILFEPRDNLALSLNGSKKFDKVKLESFQPLAEAMQLEWTTIRDWVLGTSASVFEAWRENRDELAPENRHRKILELHLSRSRLRER